MKIVTFNLRCDHGQDGDNCFVYRQPLILKAIGEEKPDVLCFQEVLPHMAQWLKESLPDYYVVGCGRGERLDGEQMSVAYRRDAYDLMRMNTFWLSETPTVPGSRYPEQSDCPRTCTEALLMEHGTGQVIRVLNTHLDHIGSLARERGLRQILAYADALSLFPDAPAVLVGDFNAEPGAFEMRALDDYPAWRCATRDIGITYHGYFRSEPPSQIDYIFLRGPVCCGGARKWEQAEQGVYLSDHYPVCAELTWEGGAIE